MMKKIKAGNSKKAVFLLCGLGLSTVLTLLLWPNPWKDETITFGHQKGSVLVLKSDAFLYRYLNSYSLLPAESFDFTVEEFSADHSIGIIDQECNIYVAKVISAGTEIEFHKIKWKNDWNTTGYYLQYARFIDETLLDEEFCIWKMFEGPYGAPSDRYLKPVESLPVK